MRSFERKSSFPLFAIALVLLTATGCQSNSSAQSLTANASPASSLQAGKVSGTESSAANPASASEGSGAPGSSTQSNPAMETSPAWAGDWREVPVSPEISPRVFEIYQAGLAQGRNPHNFSVIGDCQAIPLVFMGPFERGELQPDSSESHLWDAIRQFEGSFWRTGMAVRGGFNAASILSPLQADPHYCLSGETPLSCEYRLQNPAIAFVMLETWLDPDTIDRYENYLRQILDFVIARGTIPILMTKADAAEAGNGVPVINPAIVRVAREYDVPVINFWRSAQYLDDHGIDPNREGFHLSPEGFKLKNILALRTLHKVWTEVIQGAGTPNPALQTGAPTVTPGIQGTSAAQTDLRLTVPDCDGGCIFMGTAISRDGAVTAHGVLAINYLTKKKTQILEEGFDLQDVSRDGQRLLANRENNLYEINLTDASIRRISESFFSWGKQDAYWNEDDSQAVYLDLDHPIQTETGDAIHLFPSRRDGEIYFESGTCTRKDNCQAGGVYHLDSNQTLTRMDSYSQLVFSPDGKIMAFLDPAAATKDNYYHISSILLEETAQGLSSRRLFYFPGEKGFMVNPDVREFAFSADADKLFILYDVYSDYYERSLRIQTYGYDLSTRKLSDYGKIDGASGSLKPHLVWAPQEKKVLLFLTDLTSDDQYSMSIYQANPETEENVAPYAEGILIRSDYFYITNLYWR